AAGDGEMVVLDEHRVVEAEAVVAAAAGADGVLLERAKAGGGLAGADDAGVGAGDGVDDAAGGGGDAGEVTEEVQRDALASEDRAGRALPICEGGAGVDDVAVGRTRVEADARVEQCEHPCRHLEAGDAARAARHDATGEVLRRRHDRVGGEVAGESEIFLERTAQQRVVLQRVQREQGLSAHRKAQRLAAASSGSAARVAAVSSSSVVANVRWAELESGAGKSRRQWAPRLSSRNSAAAVTRRPTVTRLRSSPLAAAASLAIASSSWSAVARPSASRSTPTCSQRSWRTR